MKALLRAFVLILLFPVVGQAQTPQSSLNAQTAPVATLPDPATIEVPDVIPTHDPKIFKAGYKFYYFHSATVSFTQAYEDLRECRAFLAAFGAGQVPGYVPFNETHTPPEVPSSQPYGLVGVGIGAIVVPKIERGLRSNKMRRCMGTRGYARYAIPERIWDVLNEGDEQKLLLVQAKLASGPKPLDEEVTE